MSTTRKIAHNTAIQIVGKATSTILGLFAIKMMTNYLGPEQFGWYSTVIIFLQFVGILVDFGMTPVTGQMLNLERYKKNTAVLFKNLLAFRFTTAAIAFGLVPLFIWFFPYNTDIKIAISFTTISFLAIAMNQVLTGLYQTKLKLHIHALGENIGRIVLVIGLWLLIQNGAAFLPFLGVITLASVTFTAVLWLTAARYTQIGFAFDLRIWKDIATRMWPIAIAILFNVIYLKGDSQLLTFFRGAVEVGYYHLSYRVIDIMTQIAMMSMGIFLPLLTYAWSHKKLELFRTRYQQAFDMMMLLALPAVVGTIAIADKIIILISGTEYLAAAAPLRILSIGVLGLFFGAVYGHAAVAIEKQKEVIWIYASNAIITLIGYLIVIPAYGMIGAAWMTVFSEWYAGIALFFFVRHHTKERLTYQTTAKIIFAALVMGALVYQIRHLHIFALLAIGGAVYSFFVLGLGAVSKKTLLDVLGRKQNV